MLTGVWHIPKLSRILFSVGRFTKDVGPVTFERDGCFAETKDLRRVKAKDCSNFA